MTDQSNRVDNHEQTKNWALRGDDQGVVGNGPASESDVFAGGSAKRSGGDGGTERPSNPERSTGRKRSRIQDRPVAFLDMDGQLGRSRVGHQGGNRGATGLGGNAGSSLSGLTPEQVLPLRALLIIDTLFLSNAARRQLMSFLIKEEELSAEAGWSVYQRSIRWWSIRVPVSYLLLSGVGRYAMDLDLGVDLIAPIGGVVFLVSICMSLAAAMRLLPLRKQFDPPEEWIAFARTLVATSQSQ